MANPLLSGKFLIRTFRTGNFVTARDGGHHSIDALISSATVPGPNEVFTFQPGDNFQHFVSTAKNFFLSARNGASNDTETFQTEAQDFRDDEKLKLTGPAEDGTFSIQTLTSIVFGLGYTVGVENEKIGGLQINDRLMIVGTGNQPDG